MSNTEKVTVGISVLTAAGVGRTSWQFGLRALQGKTVVDATIVADQFDMPLQLLPLQQLRRRHMPGLRLQGVMSFEDRWGPWHHPFRQLVTPSQMSLKRRIMGGLAYYLIFHSSARANARKLNMLRNSFTAVSAEDAASDAVRVDTGEPDCAHEVSPNTNPNGMWWYLKAAAEGWPLVIDTHHICEFDGVAGGIMLHHLMKQAQFNCPLVHAQFETREQIERFLVSRKDDDNQTRELLERLAADKRVARKVVIETPPGVLDEHRLPMLRDELQLMFSQ